MIAGQAFYKVNLDEKGEYSIESVGVGEWWIGIAPPPATTDGREHLTHRRADTSGLFRSISTVQITTLESDYEVDLVGYRGLSVRGTVVTPEGEPVPKAAVEAKFGEDDEFAMYQAWTNDRGEFELSPLPPGV
jgi:hypothetical protein